MELRHYITVLGRWWWLIVLLTGVAAAASYVVSYRQTPVYQAITTIMVGQSIQSVDLMQDDIQTSQVLAVTYADMARRQPVLQQVIDTLQLDDDWKDLKDRVSARWVVGTQLLEVVVEASSPEEAKLVADAIANQLILLSPTSAQNQEEQERRNFVQRRLQELQTKIEAGQKRLKTLEEAMAGSLSSQQVKDLQSEINTLEGLITNWENTYTQLLIFAQANKSANFLAITEPAQSSSKPTRPQVQLNTLLAGAVGLILSLLLILLLEYLDDTFKSVDELSLALGVSTLGAVGPISEKRYPHKLVTSQDLFSPAAEAYRLIRNNLHFMTVGKSAKSFMVTSPSPGEGKSITVANLGVVMAHAGLKTIIVDADLRRPVQHEIFQAPNFGGITDLLRSPQPEIESYLKKTGVPNLYLLTGGVTLLDPSALGSAGMKQLLDSLTQWADVVICDSSPILAIADTLVLSHQVDGVILVTQANQTRRSQVRRAVMSLRQAQANLLGGVLNRASHRGVEYYPIRPELADQVARVRFKQLWRWSAWK